MTTKTLSFKSLPSLAIAEGATTPNPGSPGVWAWSQTLTKPVFWNGSSWTAGSAGGGGSGDVVGPASSLNNSIPAFSGTTGKLLKSSSLSSLDDGVNIFGYETKLAGGSEEHRVFSQVQYIEPFGYTLETGVSSTFAGPVEKIATLTVGPFSTPGLYLVSGPASVSYSINEANSTAEVLADGGFNYGNPNGTVFGVGPLGQLKLGTGQTAGTNDQVMTSRGTANSPIWQSLKTVNGNSLLGTGDIVISGGAGSGDVVGPASAADNHLTVFSGTTGKIIKEATFFDIPDLANIPAPPSNEDLRIFARKRAGRAMLHMIGPSGIDVALQPGLFGNSVSMWSPSTGTTVSTNFGTSWTARNSGTGAAQAHPGRAATNALTSMVRATFGTGTTATGTSGIQSTLNIAWRGNAANLGGWFWFSRFAVETTAADIRLFVGLSTRNAALNADPSTFNHSIGLCKDSADANWSILSRSTVATKTPLPTALPVTAGQILDFIMFAPTNGSSVIVRVVDSVSGTVYTDDLEITSNLPQNTQFMYAHASIQSVTGTTAKLLALNRIYVETDL